MRHIALLDQLEFNDDRAHSEPLFVDSHARLLRFALRPGQSIAEHNAPNSPFYVVGVAGRGVFTDGDGESHMVLPNDLLVFDVGEKHSVAAGDEDFVFLGILLSAPKSATDTSVARWRGPTAATYSSNAQTIPPTI